LHAIKLPNSSYLPFPKPNTPEMRSIACLLLSFLILFTAWAQELSYYLPTNVRYNPNIPTPESIIGHKVGEWHITHDRLVNYMKAIDAASDRVTLQQTGLTYEGRPQLLLTITATTNQAKIETLRKEHLLLSDAKQSAGLNTGAMPAVVWIGCSIHGNEPSGANASLLTAYYLAAAEGPAIDDLLSHTIILIDPSFNPDGLNRFASWVNTHKSATQVSDPNAREFNETWPGGRTNHYWFDLNRDWLPAQLVESQHRLVKFQEWMPNILTDHHEMGSNSTFFFQPGVPSRVNPNTPKLNQELTMAIGRFHAKFLDSIGSLYFTREGYDDFYYGKGSTYPDINGGIGILFEQASSRGHAQETENGLLSFPFTIRNQFTTSLSTLEAARSLRKELLNYQRGFYSDASREATASPVKGYVFGNSGDKSRESHFIEMLRRHKIDIYTLKNNLSSNGTSFNSSQAFVVPVQQRQSRLIKTIFETTFKYEDSLFYDISTWTMPLAFGIPAAEINTDITPLLGAALEDNRLPVGEVIGGSSNYAYVFRYNDYYAPKLVYALQSKGLMVKTATRLFEATTAQGKANFSYGTMLVPVQLQSKSAEDVYRIISEAVKGTGEKVYAISSGLANSGIDLGSGSFSVLRQPKVMVFAGNGTSGNDVGEVWFQFDQRMKMPVTLLDADRFNATSITRYNVIVMPPGNYNTLDKNAQDKLKAWVSNGGTLVALEDAAKWLSANGITKVMFRADDAVKDSVKNLPYHLRSDETRAKDMPGSIFETKLDLTHPLCYGYTQSSLSVFKQNTLFMDQNNDPYDSPVMFTATPLQSGYFHPVFTKRISGSAEVNIDAIGRGRVISFADNLCFRAFWFGTSRLLMNAVLLGDLVR
jgi:Zinc carboxypeptidase